MCGRGAAAGREAAVPRGVRPYLTERREKAAAADREVLVRGDWNMAVAEAYVCNWRSNLNLRSAAEALIWTHVAASSQVTLSRHG
jgi:hypothetical protein